MSKNDQCVVSGFQSRVEKEVLDVILENNGIAVMVLAYSIFKKCPEKYRKAVEEKRLLIVSFFDDKQTVITRQSAETRNLKVLELCDSVIVGYMKSGGMTEKIIRSTGKKYTVLK